MLTLRFRRVDGFVDLEGLSDRLMVVCSWATLFGLLERIVRIPPEQLVGTIFNGKNVLVYL